MTATITRTRNNLCGSHPPIHFPAEPGMKENQSFGDMRIPGNIGPVSLVLVCAMRVINGLPPANLICFIINPTKAVWARLGWLECMRVQVAWSGNYPPHGNHHHCLHSVRTQHWSYHLTSHHSSQRSILYLRLCWDNIPLLLLGFYFRHDSRSVNILMVILMDWGIFPMRLNKYC